MKRKLSIFFIASIILTCSARAEYGFDTPADYTGEAFFAPPAIEQPSGFTSSSHDSRGNSHTTPPIKQLRLKLQELERAKEQQYYELAPTANDLYSGEIGTSEFASKELEDNFEEMNPDGFDADEEFVEETAKQKKRFFKKKKKEQLLSEENESIILDCEKVDYDTNNYLVYATGNVNVEFVKQKINVKADVITFDRMNNTIKAEGDVKIIKSGKVITGDYIFVDMNEENALIENPLTRTGNIEIRAQKGYVYGDKIVQENGTMEIKDSFPINFHSGNRGPQMRRMLVPKGETLSDDMEKIYSIKFSFGLPIFHSMIEYDRRVPFNHFRHVRFIFC